MLNDMRLASARAPVDTVRPVAPEYVRSTTGVPDIVRLVMVPIPHGNPPPAPVTIILPVPKLTLRVLELLDEKLAIVSSDALSAIDPAVNVNAPVKVTFAPTLNRTVAVLKVTVEVVAPD